MKKAREIKLVYQDCPMCGSRKKWGKAQTEIADTHGLKIVKTPFTDEGARGLILEAVADHGIKSLPFFTDGEKFSKTLEDFVTRKSKKASRAAKSRGHEEEAEAVETGRDEEQLDVPGEDA